MLIRNGQVSELLPSEQSVEVDGRILHWRGFVHLPGHAAGAPSLAACSWDGDDAVRRSVGRLRGSYLLSVLDPLRNEHRVVTGGFLDGFLAGGVVSTSFLRLCDHLGTGLEGLDPDAVAEFLDLGFVLGRRTLVTGVGRLVPGRIYTLLDDRARHDGGGPPAIDVAPQPGYSIQEHFRLLAGSLTGTRVSSDLTGGSDSRLVAALLPADLDVEFAITGVAGNSDIRIARQVAAALDRPIHVLEHDISGLEDGLDELFTALDGLGDLVAHHRTFENARSRRARGVQVSLSGAGGELYKDFWWLQDFPRYRSRRTRTERLIDLRIRPRHLPADLLTGTTARAAAGVGRRLLDACRALEMPVNTQSYDRIYYDVKMAATTARFTSMNASYVPSFTPLLAPELVRVGYALPRRDRFFNRYHRRVVSAAAPAAAAIPTTEGGTTLASGARAQAAETAAYARDKLRRLAAKTRQVRSGAELDQESPDHPDLVPAARDLPAFARSVERLRSAGVLAGRNVPAGYVGRVLALGMLASRLAGAGGG